MIPQKRKRKHENQGKQKGGKGFSVPPLPREPEDDEVVISDEDVEFVTKNYNHVGFLANLDTNTITRQVLGLHSDHNSDDLESYYEKKAKVSSAEGDARVKEVLVDPVDALPVKTLDGELHYGSMSKEFLSGKAMSTDERRAAVKKGVPPLPAGQDRISVEKDQGKDHGPETEKIQTKAERKKKEKDLRRKYREENKQGSVTEIQKIPSLAGKQGLKDLEEFVSVHQRRDLLKNRMAEIGTGLLRDPEGSFMSLKELEEMCVDRDDSVSQFAMISTLAVFKDIIPGYVAHSTAVPQLLVSGQEIVNPELHLILA